MSIARRILMLAPWDESRDVETYPLEHPLRKARLGMAIINCSIALLSLLVNVSNTDLAAKLLLLLIGNGSLTAALNWQTGLKARGANMLLANVVLAVILHFIFTLARQ